MNHLYHDLVFSGIHIGFVWSRQASFGMLFLQHTIQSRITIYSWSRCRASLRSKQLDTKLFHWRTIHGRLLTMVLQTMRLDFSLYSWTGWDISIVPTLSNNQLSWENTSFCSVSSLRTSTPCRAWIQPARYAPSLLSSLDVMHAMWHWLHLHLMQCHRQGIM